MEDSSGIAFASKLQFVMMEGCNGMARVRIELQLGMVGSNRIAVGGGGIEIARGIALLIIVHSSNGTAIEDRGF
jgi:hypothetical protein